MGQSEQDGLEGEQDGAKARTAAAADPVVQPGHGQGDQEDEQGAEGGGQADDRIGKLEGVDEQVGDEWGDHVVGHVEEEKQKDHFEEVEAGRGEGRQKAEEGRMRAEE